MSFQAWNSNCIWSKHWDCKTIPHTKSYDMISCREKDKREIWKVFSFILWKMEAFISPVHSEFTLNWIHLDSVDNAGLHSDAYRLPKLLFWSSKFPNTYEGTCEHITHLLIMRNFVILYVFMLRLGRAIRNFSDVVLFS